MNWKSLDFLYCMISGTVSAFMLCFLTWAGSRFADSDYIEYVQTGVIMLTLISLFVIYFALNHAFKLWDKVME